MGGFAGMEASTSGAAAAANPLAAKAVGRLQATTGRLVAGMNRSAAARQGLGQRTADIVKGAMLANASGAGRSRGRKGGHGARPDSPAPGSDGGGGGASPSGPKGKGGRKAKPTYFQLLQREMERRGPRRELTREEKYWQAGVFCSGLFDLGASAFFAYQGFYLHEDDRVMDPIAWRLGFGAIVVFNIFKNLQIAMTLTEWFAIWLGCMVILCLGHFYGAVRMFLWLYAQVFPCFRGYEDDAEGFQMCYRGQILIGHTAATLFLAGSCFFLWLWRNHTIASLKRRGLYEQSLDLDQLLNSVDEKMVKYHKKSHRSRKYKRQEKEEAEDLPLMQSGMQALAIASTDAPDDLALVTGPGGVTASTAIREERAQRRLEILELQQTHHPGDKSSLAKIVSFPRRQSVFTLPAPKPAPELDAVPEGVRMGRRKSQLEILQEKLGSLPKAKGLPIEALVGTTAGEGGEGPSAGDGPPEGVRMGRRKSQLDMLREKMEAMPAGGTAAEKGKEKAGPEGGAEDAPKKAPRPERRMSQLEILRGKLGTDGKPPEPSEPDGKPDLR